MTGGDIVIPTGNLVLYLWRIGIHNQGGFDSLKWQKVFGSGVEDFEFSSFDDAFNFLRWLKMTREKPSSINQRRVGIGGQLKPLTKTNVDNLSISIENINPCHMEN